MQRLWKIVFTLVAVLGSASWLVAALPPLYENIREIESVLRDSELTRYFQAGETIESIQRVHEGWRLSSNQRTMLAKIIYQPPHNPGPALFEIEWLEVEALVAPQDAY